MPCSQFYAITETQKRSAGSLVTFLKEFSVDDWNRGLTLSKYPNVIIRPSAFPFKFKGDPIREASPNGNCTLVRNSITTLRPVKPQKKNSKSSGYRESFRKRLSNAEVVYRRSFLINDEDTEKWHIYDPCYTKILKESPPDVPLRSTSLFQDKEAENRRPNSVYVPINGPLLLTPSKSFEKKTRNSSQKRYRSPGGLLTKNIKMSGDRYYEDTEVSVGQPIQGNGIQVYPITVLGKGTFGTCWLAWNGRRKELVVAKIPKQGQTAIDSMRYELDNLMEIWKANDIDSRLYRIIMLTGNFDFNGANVLLFEPVGPTLLDLLQVTEKGVPIEKIIWGLQYLHAHKMVHADLKPENVMIQLPRDHFVHLAINSLEDSLTQGADFEPGLIEDIKALSWPSERAQISPKEIVTRPGEFNFTVKIGDFGSAEFLPIRLGKIIGTREYRAPEVLLATPLGTAVDIWSLGTMIYEMVTNRYLFDPRGNVRNDTEEALDREHLRQMLRYIEIPPVARGKKYSANFYSKSDRTFIKLLFDMGLEKDDALRLGAFLRKALKGDSTERATTSDLLVEPFLIPKTDAPPPNQIIQDYEPTVADQQAQEFVPLMDVEAEDPRVEVVDVYQDDDEMNFLPLPPVPIRTTSILNRDDEIEEIPKLDPRITRQTMMKIKKEPDGSPEVAPVVRTPGGRAPSMETVAVELSPRTTRGNQNQRSGKKRQQKAVQGSAKKKK